MVLNSLIGVGHYFCHVHFGFLIDHVVNEDADVLKFTFANHNPHELGEFEVVIGVLVSFKVENKSVNV